MQLPKNNPNSISLLSQIPSILFEFAKIIFSLRAGTTSESFSKKSIC